MKRVLVAVFTAVVFISTLFSGGCSTKKFSVYTNVPKERFEIVSKNYSVSGEIEGNYIFKNAQTPENLSDFENRSKDFYAMNEGALLTVSDVFTDEREADFINLTQEIDAMLSAVENSLSVKLPQSFISKFNEAAAGASVELDKTAYNVLKTALDIHTLTEGYYNPAVYYSVERYGFNNNFNYPQSADGLPPEEEILKYKELSSHFNETQVYAENGTYYAVKPDFTVDLNGKNLSLKIDLGGVGKGYAADMVDGLLNKYNFGYGYFSFGTSSIVCKNHYRAGEYTLEFVDPRAKVFGSPYMRMKLSSDKVSTSGDYEQYYILDGVRYCHIIDPFTGSPIQTGIMTATVIGGSAAENDAITTAIMAMGRERAMQFIKDKLSNRIAVFTAE